MTATNYGFVIDNRRCIGCHACTVACKSEHEDPIVPRGLSPSPLWIAAKPRSIHPNALAFGSSDWLAVDRWAA